MERLIKIVYRYYNVYKDILYDMNINYELIR